MTEVGERVQFDDVGTHSELLAWSERYCRRAIAVHDLAVALDRIEWSVSTRARRRAAAVKTPRVEGAAVGEPRDWETLRAGDRGTRSDDHGNGAPTCELRLSWVAFEAFDRAEWRETLRHELVHVEQFQRFGATDHGPEFRERATELDAPLRCRRFAEANYHLHCGECDAVVARRYRASKLVERPESYRSDCCGASLTCVER